MTEQKLTAIESRMKKYNPSRDQRALFKEVRKLRAVLKSFADAAEAIEKDQHLGDGFPIGPHPAHYGMHDDDSTMLRLGQLREAREVLEGEYQGKLKLDV